VTRPAASWAVATLAALLALSLLLPGLGRAPFDDPGEGQHAEIAREAWASGDPLDLRLNGVRYFDKPPLLYWAVMETFQALGENAILPPFLAAWAPNLIFAATGLYLVLNLET
jgi:4-amino-4-deoxy-L-arabinose transferase-like glycosyltransferase